MYGLCDFTQMCIEYTFILGYDNKENSLPSLVVSTLSLLCNPQVVGSIPMSDECFFSFLLFTLLFILFSEKEFSRKMKKKIAP